MKTTIKEVELKSLTETKHNPRQISKKDFDILKKSLKEFPEMQEIREIVVDENMTILGGHQRVKAMMANGQKTATVKIVEGLTDKQKREFIIKDNIQNGEWDMDILANEWDIDDLNDWGLDEVKKYKEIVEDTPAPVDKENTYSIVGDIYQLGEHRIFCGSFEDDEKVKKLFGGKKAVCTFTDPPYNVAVKNRSTGKTIQNDNMAHEDFQAFLNRAFECVASNMVDGGGCISWMSDVEILTLKNAFDHAGLKFKTVLCWVKSQFTLGGNDFQSAKELAIYGLGEGKYDGTFDETGESQYACYARGGGKFTDSRKLSNVWFFDKPKSSKDHPTMKPIGLCAKGILAMSDEGDIVFDPFSGSGSTLIACEQTGRKCYGCEIDPKYCDVIRKRWVKLTTGSEDNWQELTPKEN